MARTQPQAETRPVREPGRRTRSALLDAAAALFKSRGLSAVSVAQIAEAADAFPNQVTYYFRTKEALFVEAACREILYVARQAEAAAAGAPTPDSYGAALARTVMQADGLALFVEALALARRRQDLAPLTERTFERLHQAGDRAYAEVRTRRGWGGGDTAITARRFWTLAIGLALQEGATGATREEACAELITLLSGPRRPSVALVEDR